MDAVIFIVDTFLSLAVYAFLLRLLLQLSRADFRNPLAQAILKLTSWLVLPLRRLLPPVGRVDTASVVAVLLAQLARMIAVSWLAVGAVMAPLPLLQATVVAVLVATLGLYTVAIIVYALLSLIAPGNYSPASALLATLCEPLLAPVRRLLPPVGGLDFSPLLVIVALQAVKLLIT
ncbi:MAG: YggT family protein [Steroidobacteraceae bacterium]|nr:YggT family protein [Steroidobacteraceae bacterium]